MLFCRYYLFTVLVITVAALAPGIVYRTYMRIYHPMDHEILQAMEKGEHYMGERWVSTNHFGALMRSRPPALSEGEENKPVEWSWILNFLLVSG